MYILTHYLNTSTILIIRIRFFWFTYLFVTQAICIRLMYAICFLLICFRLSYIYIICHIFFDSSDITSSSSTCLRCVIRPFCIQLLSFCLIAVSKILCCVHSLTTLSYCLLNNNKLLRLNNCLKSKFCNYFSGVCAHRFSP